jgi:type IV pilus assembly protein PilE
MQSRDLAMTPCDGTRAAAACRGRHRGFTLIELMIAVVVAAILASLALPAFFDTLRKSRRSEAFAALVALQQSQERYRANRPAYAAALADLDTPNGPKQQTTSANGRYTLSIAAADATSYTLRAAATGDQARDADCATLLLRAARGTVEYGSACATCTPAEPLTDPKRCWSQK